MEQGVIVKLQNFILYTLLESLKLFMCRASCWFDIARPRSVNMQFIKVYTENSNLDFLIENYSDSLLPVSRNIQSKFMFKNLVK